MDRNTHQVTQGIVAGTAFVGVVAMLVMFPGCDFGQGTGSRQNAQAASLILHADEGSFDEHVLQSKMPVLVDFYADWCGPCQMLTPVLEELARETPSTRIVKINVDHSRELAERYGVSAIPSVMVFRDGKLVSRYVGVANKTQLQSMLSL